MNKKIAALIKSISDRKQKIKDLVEQNMLDEAESEKKILKDEARKLDLIVDLDDEAEEEKKQLAGEKGIVVENKKTTKAEKTKAFVHVLIAAIAGRKAKEEDVEIYNAALTEGGTGDGLAADFGVTIPQDLSNEIRELRRSDDDLEIYVNTEGVNTLSGSRVIEEDAENTEFEEIDEAGEFKDVNTPKFRLIKYAIKKYGGLIRFTKELMEDSAANIWAYLSKWMAKKTKITRNKKILAAMDGIVAGKATTIKSLDQLKDIFNTKIDPGLLAGSVFITNQNGFNYLDKLKDDTGKYILQPDATQATRKLLFGVYPIIMLSNKTIPDSTATATKGAHPCYCGNLKEAVTLFDRNVLSFEMNDKGDGWDHDIVKGKARDRFDVQAVDTAAIVGGLITETA